MLSLHRPLLRVPLRTLSPYQLPAPHRLLAVRTFAVSMAAGQHFPPYEMRMGRPRLPVNTGVLFVPQQEAWVRPVSPLFSLLFRLL